jgi:hypothetical protein
MDAQLQKIGFTHAVNPDISKGEVLSASQRKVTACAIYRRACPSCLNTFCHTAAIQAVVLIISQSLL